MARNFGVSPQSSRPSVSPPLERSNFMKALIDIVRVTAALFLIVVMSVCLAMPIAYLLFIVTDLG